MAITIRIATADDANAVATLTAAGFRESRFEAAVFPEDRRIKPDIGDRIEFLRDRMRQSMAKPTSHYIVATEDGVVVGTAQWISPGETDRQPAASTSPEEAERAMKARMASLPSYLNSDAIIQGGKEVQDLMDRCAEGFSGLDKDRMWSLNSIAVDAKHRRKGIAKRLTQWGIDEAKKQGKDVWLVANGEGMPVYKGCGFRVLGEGSRFGDAQFVMLLEQSNRFA